MIWGAKPGWIRHSGKVSVKLVISCFLLFCANFVFRPFIAYPPFMSRNRLWCSFIFLLFTVTSYGQITPEKGYFINNDGVRTECFVRDADRLNNPDSFKYKISPTDELREANIDEVQEFGTENGAVYIRAKVNVDQSEVNLDLLSSQRAPEWSEKLVFLKTLVKGAATLYVYRWSGITRFYYQKGTGPVMPLVYKRYRDDAGNVRSNFGFRQELLNALQCESVPAGWVGRLNYLETDMLRFFNRYNACAGPGQQTVVPARGRETFNLRITPGAELIMLKSNRYTRFEDGSKRRTNASGRIGLEAEYILPFNKNKWG